MKIVHTADWHLSSNKVHQEKAKHSLDQLTEFCRSESVDGIIIAGDLWDKIQLYGNDSGIKIGYKYLRQLSALTKFIFVIKGNPSHDANQSIELVNKLEKNIFTCENNVAVGIKLNSENVFTNLFAGSKEEIFDLMLHGISYPTKANLLEGNSIDQHNFNFIEKLSRVMELHGSVSDAFTDTPRITAFHGSVSGCKLSSGQTLIGQDIIVPAYILEKTKSDYYCLGHIHMPQNITPTMRYSGSIYNKDFGEIEQKYFDVIEIDYPEIKISHQPFKASRPMVIVDAEFRDGKFVYDNHLATDAEVKFRYEVKENERDLVTSDYLEELKSKFGDDLKIESRIVPSERNSRSKNIMKAKTLIEEVTEYAKIVGEELTESIKEKVLNIEVENYQGVEIK